MKLQGYKRLITEDFNKDQQDIVSKLGYIINAAFDSIFQAFNKNITIEDNLNQSLVDISVKVNPNGIPVVPVQIKYSLKTNCKGAIVIGITNLESPGSFPTNQPFITLEQTGSSLLTIKHITGLSANTEYSLKTILIGG